MCNTLSQRETFSSRYSSDKRWPFSPKEYFQQDDAISRAAVIAASNDDAFRDSVTGRNF